MIFRIMILGIGFVNLANQTFVKNEKIKSRLVLNRSNESFKK